jgi:DNA-binding beta-propeller fold protein YncE
MRIEVLMRIEAVAARAARSGRPRLVGRGGRLALVALLLAGCATRWTPRAVEPAVALQWPYAPAPAKLTHLRSLRGFSASATVGSTLRAVAYGRGEDDAGAFVLPVAVATGSDGRIAVADLGGRCVHLYLPAQRRYLRLEGSGEQRLESPVAVAFDGAGSLWVADSAGRLLAFAADGSPRLVLARAGDAALRRPTGLAYDPARGWLYLVDTLASRVYALDHDGELRLTFGEPGHGAGQLHYPTHAFWSAARGELYVTDALNFRIVVFSGEGEPRGSFGRHGDGSGDFALPKGVAVDADGTVYVADALFDNVQLFDRQGEFLLTLGGRGVALGELWMPSGLFIDPGGELYVCDTYNRRVQVYRIAQAYAPGP